MATTLLCTSAGDGRLGFCDTDLTSQNGPLRGEAGRLGEELFSKQNISIPDRVLRHVNTFRRSTIAVQ